MSNKSIDELTFTDDGMFQAVLHEPEICAELVERLLHVRVNHVEYPELEKEIAPYYTTKGVRLDVYLKDKDKIIDIEVQNYPQDALGKRARYYQSMIDMDSLMKGEDYTNLKESYVLFICKNDPFKDENNNNYGLPCYTFRNICEENNAVNLNDNSCKVIYNVIKNCILAIFEIEFLQTKTRRVIVRILSSRHPWRKKNASLGDSRNSVFA
ncbi:MAG: Rpn family recombination-promoting nuclease/putative transposase [Spirochaetales bacterium]|nr:Rpn family recombination-promoting nuclease/putative transposase [Spirochaetales bacterium]